MGADEVLEPAGVADDAAVVVEITPRDYRLRALIATAGGLLALSASAALSVLGDGYFNVFPGLSALVYGIYCVRRARAHMTHPVLRIDRAGVHAQDGEYERRWGGVVLVWVGSQSGFRVPFVAQPVLSFFTMSGLDFARRAGVRPRPLYTIAVGGRQKIPDLCHRLQALTTADVIDGRLMSRRNAALALQRSGAISAR